MDNINSVNLEILKQSYWEHHKFEKELLLSLNHNDPKILKVQNELNKLQKQIYESAGK